MSKRLSFWAALAAIEGLLSDNQQTVYLWTFTGESEAVRQDVKLLHRCWHNLIRSEGWQKLDVAGFRATEQGKRGTQAFHIHFVTSKRIPIRRVLELGQRVGFGRINVREIPRSRAGYAAKYLTKGMGAGYRRWASLGDCRRVRQVDMRIFDRFKQAATETRSTFPVAGATGACSAEYWWSECLRGLAADFLRVNYNLYRPMQIDPSEFLPDASASALEAYSDGMMRAMKGASDRAHDGAVLHPRVGIYRGRWVPEFLVTDKGSGRTWGRRQARHLVEIGGVPWWIREPGDVPLQRPARPGDLVLVSFVWDAFDPDEKMAGDAVGYVDLMMARRGLGVNHPQIAEQGAPATPAGPEDVEAAITAICGQWAVNAKRMAMAGLPAED